jgi:prohibitin 1
VSKNYTIAPDAPDAGLEFETEPDLKEDNKARRQARWKNRWLAVRRSFKTIGVLLILSVLVLVLRKRMFITVRSGEVLVVYYWLMGGSSHDRIGYEGLHVIFPWDDAYLYNIRTQALAVPMTVLSKDGVEVHLDAQIRFHPIPEMVPYLHRRYGPNYVQNIVVPQVIEAVQRAIGQFLPEELYSSENGASVDRIFENAKRLIGGVFFEVEDIALFNIRVPPRVQQSMQEKAEAQQGALAYGYRVQQEQEEQQRMLIEAKGLQQYEEIVKGIPRSVLVWKGIEATLELAKSPNAKVIVMGGKDQLPLMLGNVPDLAAEK